MEYYYRIKGESIIYGRVIEQGNAALLVTENGKTKQLPKAWLGETIFNTKEEAEKRLQQLRSPEHLKKEAEQLAKEFHENQAHIVNDIIRCQPKSPKLTMGVKNRIIENYSDDADKENEMVFYSQNKDMDYFARIDLDTLFYNERFKDHFSSHHYDRVYISRENGIGNKGEATFDKRIYPSSAHMSLTTEPGVNIVDWRHPIAGLFYDNARTRMSDKFYIQCGVHGRYGPITSTPGDVFEYELMLKRRYEFSPLRFVNTYISGGEVFEEGSADPFLLSIMDENRSRRQIVDIIKTIQSNQNKIIRSDSSRNFLVQGCAGSGKTMILLHRLSFLYFNEKVNPERAAIITPNSDFVKFISGLSSTLDINRVAQVTMADFFRRLVQRVLEDCSNAFGKEEYDDVSKMWNHRMAGVDYDSRNIRAINNARLFPLILGWYKAELNETYFRHGALISEFEKLHRIRGILFANDAKDDASRYKGYISMADEIIRLQDKLEQKCSDFLNYDINAVKGYITEKTERVPLRPGMKDDFKKKVLPAPTIKLDDAISRLRNTQEEIKKLKDIWSGYRSIQAEIWLFNSVYNIIRFKDYIFMLKQELSQKKRELDGLVNKNPENAESTDVVGESNIKKIKDTIEKLERDIPLRVQDVEKIRQSIAKNKGSISPERFGPIMQVESDPYSEFEKQEFEKTVQYASDMVDSIKALIPRLNVKSESFPAGKEIQYKLYGIIEGIGNSEHDPRAPKDEAKTIEAALEDVADKTGSRQERMEGLYKAIVQFHEAVQSGVKKIGRITDFQKMTLSEYEKNVILRIRETFSCQRTFIIDLFFKLKNQLLLPMLAKDSLPVLPEKIYGKFELGVFLFLVTLFNRNYRHAEQLICIDEAQDYSLNEYALLSTVFDKDCRFNIYGDINQSLDSVDGLHGWGGVRDLLECEEYALNENYRNSVEIASFINETLNIASLPIGIHGPEVEALENVDGIYNHFRAECSNGRDDRIAIIYKERDAQLEKLSELCSFFEQSRVSMKTVIGAKGLEFDTVFVITKGMDSSEQYIAFSRALNKLYYC